MTEPLEHWVELVETEGLEVACRAYYSVYRALVLDNADPEERGRIRISCPQVGHDAKTPLDVWVDPAQGTTGDRMGWFDPPLQGSVVRVGFDNGDPSKPKVYWGGWFSKSDGKIAVPTEMGYVNGKPQKRGYRSRAGHLLVFNDTPGEESVDIVWHQIAAGDPAGTDPDAVAADIAAGDKIATLSFDKDAVQLIDSEGQRVVLNSADRSILLQAADGALVSISKDGIALMDNASPASTLQMDGKGKITLIAKTAITLNAPTVDLKTGGVTLGDQAVLSAVIFEQLQLWANSHVHTSAAPASPSSPPVVPLLPTAKSMKVKLS